MEITEESKQIALLTRQILNEAPPSDRLGILSSLLLFELKDVPDTMCNAAIAALLESLKEVRNGNL